MNTCCIDPFHMMIVAKYFVSITDFLFLQQVSKKYNNFLSKFHFNPIPLTTHTRPFFPNLETLHIYSNNDNQFDYEKFYQKVVWFSVKKSQTVKPHSVLYKNVSYDEKDIFLYNTSTNNKCVVLTDIYAKDFDFNKLTYFRNEKDFEPLSQITTLILPPHLTSLKYVDHSVAFKSLLYVTFPLTLKVIGRSFFESCSSLLSLDLPATLTSIENYAFSYCTSLQDITFRADYFQLGQT
ncbi:hypothetical protein EIN_045350, partial [Entamoeba invadens IP1]